MNQAKEQTMAITHAQSNATSAAPGASVAARGVGDAKSATGFEALFALELEALDSTAIGEMPQDGEPPAAESPPSTPPETAETLLASGLVLPERTPARPSAAAVGALGTAAKQVSAAATAGPTETAASSSAARARVPAALSASSQPSLTVASGGPSSLVAKSVPHAPHAMTRSLR